MSSSLHDLKNDLQKASDPQKKELARRFFKSGVGQYGEGDKFLGITVPAQRLIAGKYLDLSLSDLEKLLKSAVHEERLVSLIILVNQFEIGSPKTRERIFNFYLSHAKFVNNWDLVDASADKIAGAYLLDKNRNILEKLAHSDNLWEKRISIVSTLAFIQNKEYQDTFKITEILLNDKHDLIQKAVGWMLREVGKRANREKLEEFLDKHSSKMPRTMLRYSIEHFSPDERASYLRPK
jgi:3-methyladenine DNA glycosylase AlkD